MQSYQRKQCHSDTDIINVSVGQNTEKILMLCKCVLAWDSHIQVFNKSKEKKLLGS